MQGHIEIWIPTWVIGVVHRVHGEWEGGMGVWSLLIVLGLKFHVELYAGDDYFD